MNFEKSLKYISELLKENKDNIKIINGTAFDYSKAFNYICESIEEIIGKKTNNNIYFAGILYQNSTPATINITDNLDLNLSTCISSHGVIISQSCSENPFLWVWQLSHEMVHVFLSLKDNSIKSSYSRPSLLEEGLATYISSLIYKKYFSELKINYIEIKTNDYAYDYAEEIYKKVMKMNGGDVSFVKKIRKENPSLKELKMKDFKKINITNFLIQECLIDFQTQFNRTPGNY